jgi:hypothetical protein
MSTGTTRDGKPIQAGDQVSITGTVVSVSGSGSQASLTVQCNGAAAQPQAPNVPYNITVLATDLIGTQSL